MNKKYIKLLLIVSVIPMLGYAQDANFMDFDKSFLESLPSDIREDLIKKTSENMDLEKTQYRRPSTFIEKPKSSARFGSKIFSMMQTTLMPINEPNFDGSYILDYGDVLELQLIGQKSSLSKLPIKRDGSVNIDDLGKVYLAGLSLNNAINLIKAKVTASYIGVDAFITLTNVRDIQVILAGNVFNPGSYVLNGNSNIFHALMVSGGPSEDGSFRSIDLVRDNDKIESIDLYDTFIFGQSNLNNRLRSGDMIFVNTSQKIVNISGAVKRPGEYELLEDENLDQGILFANGLDKFADTSNIKLERILDGRIKSLPISNILQFVSIKANDGDRVFIRSFPFRSVEIKGAVTNPGIYLMNEGDNIFDAINKSGGFSETAYPLGGVYENVSVKNINQKAVDLLYQDFLDNILTLSQASATSSDFASSLSLASELKKTNISGRVIVDLVDKNQKDPILVKDGDIITIPEYSNQIYIYGEVAQEGAAIFSEGKDVQYYIDKKGGLNNTAAKNSIYVLYPNGETKKVAWNKNIFVKQSNKLDLYPGSIVFVPRAIDNTLTSRLTAQAYASILGNLGVSLASLSVLRD